jgi:hypothetical protein
MDNVGEKLEELTDVIVQLRDNGKISKNVMNELIASIAYSFNLGADWMCGHPTSEGREEITYRIMSSQDRT